MATPHIPQLVEQLGHKSSPKRRAAAKKLRNLKAKEAGPALLSALRNEVKDKRTWETQYQMIMALGDSKYTESLDFLRQLAEQKFDTMIYVALGDAITRLEILSDSHPTSLRKWIDDDKADLVDGSLRSLAMLRIVPDNELIKKVIQYVSLPQNKNIQFWGTAAAPKWPKELTETFLVKMAKSACLVDTRKAAEAALNGKYLKWSPL